MNEFWDPQPSETSAAEMSLTRLIQMGTPGSRANFQKPAWLRTCTTRGDCMALLMRHCISILNSNCYISEHPLAGEKERENKILVKIYGTSRLFNGAPSSAVAPCSLELKLICQAHQEIMAQKNLFTWILPLLWQARLLLSLALFLINCRF